MICRNCTWCNPQKKEKRRKILEEIHHGEGESGMGGRHYITTLLSLKTALNYTGKGKLEHHPRQTCPGLGLNLRSPAQQSSTLAKSYCNSLCYFFRNLCRKKNKYGSKNILKTEFPSHSKTVHCISKRKCIHGSNNCITFFYIH
jgi:hypothetical protein